MRRPRLRVLESACGPTLPDVWEQRTGQQFVSVGSTPYNMKLGDLGYGRVMEEPEDDAASDQRGL